MLAVGLFILVCITPANATTVLAQGSTVEGRTIGEWTAEWWQWAYSQSIPNDAFTDTTGVYSSINQSGPVFFVAGTIGGEATRSFSVPIDTYLLVPLINVSVSESSFGGSPTEEDLRDYADSLIREVDNLFAEIDGMAVPNLFDYRELSPIFSYDAALNNPLGVPAGPSGDAVSDGYWLMIEPLSAGTHTISFGGGISEIFSVSVVDTIDVAPVPEPSTVVLMGLGLVGLAGFGRKKFKK